MRSSKYSAQCLTHFHFSDEETERQKGDRTDLKLQLLHLNCGLRTVHGEGGEGEGEVLQQAVFYGSWQQTDREVYGWQT